MARPPDGKSRRGHSRALLEILGEVGGIVESEVRAPIRATVSSPWSSRRLAASTTRSSLNCSAVVAAGDEFAFGAADHPGGLVQASSIN